MIEVEGLRKVYGDRVAVDGISFRVEPGQVFGLLGPNGAGKTTTISCLSGLIRATSGAVRLNGIDVAADPKRAKANLGVVPQELAMYPEISARENLAFWGGVQGLDRGELSTKIPRMLERVGLADRAKEPVKNFSGGMKRRLNLAIGLIHDPKVVLMDEPTVGVDPQSRVHILDLIRDRAKAGTSIVYTTHYMDEAEGLCDPFLILDQGKVIANGGLEELLEQAGNVIERASIPQPSLERLFIHLTGKDLRE